MTIYRYQHCCMLRYITVATPPPVLRLLQSRLMVWLLRWTERNPQSGWCFLRWTELLAHQSFRTNQGPDRMLERCNHGDNKAVAFWWLCTLPFSSHSWIFIFWLCHQYFSTVHVCCWIIMCIYCWASFHSNRQENNPDVPKLFLCDFCTTLFHKHRHNPGTGSSSSCSWVRMLVETTWSILFVCSAQAGLEATGLIHHYEKHKNGDCCLLYIIYIVFMSLAANPQWRATRFCSQSYVYFSIWWWGTVKNTEPIFVFRSEYFYTPDYNALIYIL